MNLNTPILTEPDMPYPAGLPYLTKRCLKESLPHMALVILTFLIPLDMFMFNTVLALPIAVGIVAYMGLSNFFHLVEVAYLRFGKIFVYYDRLRIIAAILAVLVAIAFGMHIKNMIPQSEFFNPSHETDSLMQEFLKSELPSR